jgi:hypothetical protein
LDETLQVRLHCGVQAAPIPVVPLEENSIIVEVFELEKVASATDA